ncbi:hypothetical protein ACO0LF_27335 [Undibacterium sp. Di27W]|uniref:hypothetical protein n=1 Tax=Undibacterium sp. Di27W TaxID=3413036 RepID=UPI003BF1D860
MSTASSAVKLHAPALSLRIVLAIDALTSLAMGLLLVTTSGLLSGLLGLPRDFLFMAGISLFPVVALVGFTSRTGREKHPPALLVWITILGNLAWFIASVLTMEVWFAPSVAGFVFVSVQALVVLAFTVLEYRGLRS